MADSYATSFTCPNYSGLLFAKGNNKTPFSTLIGGKRKYSTAVEFATGQEYTAGGGSQPSISETASLTAPDATKVTRSQGTNVCQIFQETIGVSYAHESNMGTLSGINVAGQQANPASETDFQIAARMQKIARDIEYVYLNGAYQKATSDAEANKTRGIIAATTTNVIASDGAELGFWLLLEAQKLVSDNGGDPSALIALMKGVHLLQVQKDAIENGMKILNVGETINGIAVTQIVTPYGIISIKEDALMPAGTVELANIEVCSPVEMLVPEKGNFFLEDLAKVGAGTKKQIFGQTGIDYGPEFCHAKITGLNTTWARPDNGILTRTVAAATGTSGTETGTTTNSEG